MSAKNITLGAVFTAKIDDFMSKMKSVENSMRRMIIVADQFGDRMRRATGNLNGRLFDDAQRGADKLREALKKLNDAAGGKNLDNLAEIIRRAGRESGGAGDGIRNLSAGLNVLEKVAGAIQAALSASTDEIIKFDQALHNLQAVSGATSDEVAVMGEQIKSMATDSKFSASEIADGMLILAQAGFSAAESMDSVLSVMKLATGTLEGFEKTADLFSSTMRAFDIDTSKAGEVADIFANAINKSKLSVSGLRTSFNYAGSVAAQMGLSLADTTTALSLLANQGLMASTMGTGFRNMMSQAINPGEKLASALQENNMALDALNPKVHGFQKVMENVSALLWDSETNTIDAAKSYELFGLRAAQVAGALTRSYMTGGGFDEMRKTIETAGAASKMAQTQTEGLGIKLQNLGVMAKNVMLALGDAGLSSVLRNLFDILKSGAVIVENFLKTELGQGTSILVGLTGAMIAANMVVVKLVAVFKSLAAAYTFATAKAAIFNAIMGINPFVAALAGVTAIIIAYKHFAEENKRVAESLGATVVSLDREVGSIRNYQTALNEAGTDQEKYRTVIGRLIEDHPQLAAELLRTTGAMDLSTVSAERMAKALADLEQRKTADSLKAGAESAFRFSVEVEKAEDFLNGLKESSNEFGTLTEKDFQQAEDAVSKTSEAYQEGLRKTAIALRDQVTAQRMTVEEAEAFIRMQSGSPRVAADMKTAFTKALTEIGAATDRTGIKMAGLTKVMQTGITDMEKSLKSAISGMDKLIQRAKDAQDKITDLNKKSVELETDYYNDLRALRQDTMTDEQKYYDDQAEAQRLLREGMAGNDLEVLKKANDLFKSLSREVKNDAGETVLGIGVTSEQAKQGITQAYEAQKKILADQRADAEKNMVQVKSDIADLNKLVADYQSKITEINATGLKLDTSAVEQSLTDLNEQLGKAEEHIISVDTSEAEKKITGITEEFQGFLGKFPDHLR